MHPWSSLLADKRELLDSKKFVKVRGSNSLICADFHGQAAVSPSETFRSHCAKSCHTYSISYRCTEENAPTKSYSLRSMEKVMCKSYASHLEFLRFTLGIPLVVVHRAEKWKVIKKPQTNQTKKYPTSTPPPPFWEVNNMVKFFRGKVLFKGCDILLIWSDYLWVSS